MQEIFKRIIERIYESGVCSGNEESGFILLNKARQIVEQAAEGYDNGWISCSERLPGKHRDVFQVTVIRLQDDYKWVQSMLWNVDEWKWWEEDEEKIDAEYYTVIAWQPLPQMYTENRKES